LAHFETYFLCYNIAKLFDSSRLMLPVVRKNNKFKQDGIEFF